MAEASIRTFRISAVVAICFASVSVLCFVHDWLALEGGALDTVIHWLFDAQLLLSPLYLGTILVLLWFLGTGVAASPSRAATLALVWIAVGLVAMGIIAAFPDAVQRIANTSAARRITPDTYREMIAPVGELPTDPVAREALLSQFDWSLFQGYTWGVITLLESLSIVVIASSAAWSIYLANRFLPALRAVAAPVTLVLMSFAYLQFVMPWALIDDYDFFIGDRVLGAAVLNAFFAGTGDAIAQIVFVGYLLTIIGLGARWARPQFR